MWRNENKETACLQPTSATSHTDDPAASWFNDSTRSALSVSLDLR